FGFIGWVLRGIAQGVFQNNPISGAVILAGIFYNSWIYRIVCLFGTLISTITALLFKADHSLSNNRLFGFHGALIAVALVPYATPHFTSDQVQGLPHGLYFVLCGAFHPIILADLAALLSPHKVLVLTMPFVLATWLVLDALLRVWAIDASSTVKGSSAAAY